MLPQTRKILAGTAVLAMIAAIPAIAQDRPESILPPGFGDPATPAPEPATNTSQPSPRPAPRTSVEGAAVEIVESLLGNELESSEPVQQVEYPRSARRDPSLAGTLDPVELGLGFAPWGGASGRSIEIIMRRMDAPLASRWAHIGLRNALLASAPSPLDVQPADWAAERAWLLLRMGEADAARLLIASVDSNRFTPKMSQVALQSALASSDPSAMCPLEGSLGKLEPRVSSLVSAICASLSGEAERAAADIEAARRRGRVGGIDLALADKVVGAGAETARAVTIEWEPVDRLNSWRYGLSTATGMMPPDRLINSAGLQTQAWLARAPMFSATQRLPAARVAAALGVLSSQALVDLYATSYDATDPDALGSTEAWQLRLAFIGRDLDARMAAMRTIWGNANSPLDKVAAQVMLARAARRVVPSSDLQSDAPDLVASLLAGGFDREAARWARVLGDMDDEPADKVWAMLALGAPDTRGLGINASRIEEFADRDDSEGKQRTAMLVAGLAGLGRINSATAGRLNRAHRLGLGGATSWSNLIDGAMRRRQAGTALILTASALQGGNFDQVRGIYMYHSINALQRTGQGYLARMIAAEALART
ncbi:hypothetical protein LZ518_01655 [Sphingomonas sp. RB56-2]|uniref:Lytic transglycosylase domain-containing protein n=1 Tax=Sphingomonas brevis TaxID=2908206 RepID=A0ABT0S625_9SPHN|nr:hypothetical protein [Sphingomonas brevis]MCL6739845.1 hypothetical protein [Sphingomonas brevis]